MENRIDYFNLYVSHNIKFKDIPLSALNKDILKLAAVWDKKDYIDVVFKLYEIDNNLDLISFARLIWDGSNEYYEMYERIFDIDPVKYFDLMPNKCKNSRMWNIMFEMDPEKYFQIMPSHFITSSMYEVLLRINFDKYFDMIDVSKVKPRLCEYIYKVAPEKLFKFIDFRYSNNVYYNDLLTKDMCLKLVELDSKCFFRDANSVYINMIFDIDPKKYFDLIPEEKINLHICEVMFKIDAEKYFLRIPMKFRTSAMCDKMFEIDSEKYFLEFPMEKRDLSKCIDMFNINPEKYFGQFPHNCRTKKMCNKVFDIDPEKYFYLIPTKHRSQEMCNKMLEINFEKYFDDVPHKYRTSDMWLKMYAFNPYYVLKELPRKFNSKEIFLKFYEINPKVTFENIYELWKTQEMCNEYFELNRESFERYVPRDMYTKEMYLELLRRDFIHYSKEISDSMIDVDTISVAKIEMDKLIQNQEFIERKDLSKLMLMVIKLYPECKEIIFIDQEEKIRNDLYFLINNGGTLEGIAEKYGVSVSIVNGILEKIKVEDEVNYNAIKDVLDMNQRGYFFNMMRDVSNLSMIINMIGPVDVKGMTLEQKIMFSYLCNKHIFNSLEEIYSFNFNKYTNVDYSNVTRFFNRVLKYNFIRSENATIPEKKTIQFNNGWLRNYDRKRFFAIKNDVPTMERRYGKNSELLTFEIEERIINVLKSEGIPLSEVIVTTAFKEYFNDNLAMYIEKLKEYDAMYLEVKKNSVGRDK